MIEIVALVLVCLANVVTVTAWTMAWVTLTRMERRLEKLEMDVGRLSWPPEITHGEADLDETMSKLHEFQHIIPPPPAILDVSCPKCGKPRIWRSACGHCGDKAP